MAEALFLIIDAEGICIGIGTKAEIDALIADGFVPSDVTLTAAVSS